MRPLILLLILTLASPGVPAGTPPAASARIPAVELCELTNNPKRYDGKIVRVHVAYFFDTTATDDPYYFFYDSACEGRERRIAPEFETMEKRARARAFELIEKHTRKNDAGTAGRVGLIVVGKFRSSEGGYGHLNQHPFGFDVTGVERVRPIDVDAVWPD